MMLIIPYKFLAIKKSEKIGLVYFEYGNGAKPEKLFELTYSNSIHKIRFIRIKLLTDAI